MFFTISSGANKQNSKTKLIYTMRVGEYKVKKENIKQDIIKYEK